MSWGTKLEGVSDGAGRRREGQGKGEGGRGCTIDIPKSNPQMFLAGYLSMNRRNQADCTESDLGIPTFHSEISVEETL